MARLVFEKPTEEQLEHIFKAEQELQKAGVTFDTGCMLDDDGTILNRDWELDWSLTGAKIVEGDQDISSIGKDRGS